MQIQKDRHPTIKQTEFVNTAAAAEILTYIQEFDPILVKEKFDDFLKYMDGFLIALGGQSFTDLENQVQKSPELRAPLNDITRGAVGLSKLVSESQKYLKNFDDLMRATKPLEKIVQK